MEADPPQVMFVIYLTPPQIEAEGGAQGGKKINPPMSLRPMHNYVTVIRQHGVGH